MACGDPHWPVADRASPPRHWQGGGHWLTTGGAHPRCAAHVPASGVAVLVMAVGVGRPPPSVPNKPRPAARVEWGCRSRLPAAVVLCWGSGGVACRTRSAAALPDRGAPPRSITAATAASRQPPATTPLAPASIHCAALYRGLIALLYRACHGADWRVPRRRTLPPPHPPRARRRLLGRETASPPPPPAHHHHLERQLWAEVP